MGETLNVRLADTLSETDAETLGDTMVNVEAKALVYTVSDKARTGRA